jgi:hypothetical protein
VLGQSKQEKKGGRNCVRSSSGFHGHHCGDAAARAHHRKPHRPCPHLLYLRVRRTVRPGYREEALVRVGEEGAGWWEGAAHHHC